MPTLSAERELGPRRSAGVAVPPDTYRWRSPLRCPGTSPSGRQLVPSDDEVVIALAGFDKKVDA
jgi:hypothetical protein